MTIPFLGIFKRFFVSAPSAAPVAAVRHMPTEKPAGERLSKTVMPNTTRVLAPPDPFRVASASGPKSGGREMSPTVAVAVESRAERSISLQLSDILEHVPAGHLKPVESFDASRGILLKASEIEKGMSSGRPTVSLGSIYEQAPEIFLESIAPGDATEVSLPYAKVLQQFASVHVRSDQLCDQEVPQVETPFLQVTLEDTARFGTSIKPLETSALPPVKVEPATAKTLSKAEPEPVAREKVKPGSTPLPSVKLDPSPAPTRIPFHLPPNGAGEPASERVPALSGPPVPTSPPKPATPARIPFKVTSPPADLRPKFTLVPGVDPQDEVAQAEKPAEEKKEVAKITLGLQVVMRNVPAFQLKGDLPEIPADVRIEFPFSLVEPQLASGRVAIDPKTFQAALPETYRDLFSIDPTETPVLLPLQEVLSNLPTAALKMRTDQEEVESVNYFQTPFSLHADEDKRRFGGAAGDAPKPTEGAVKEPAPAAPESAKAEPPVVEKVEPATAAAAPALEAEKPAPAPIEEKAVVDKEGKSEAKEFVTRISSLAGVQACAITFADGLSLAGNLPLEVAADGLCAMAPSVLQKIEKHMLETKLGPLTAMTLHCAKSPVTFFMRGNVCLTVLHTDRQLESATQEKLTEMIEELSQTYAQSETGHVDH